MVKVSVITPVYNSELYLRQCLDSLLAQTLEQIEFILVDDGSPDGSPAICDEYAKRDSRVRVVHKENGGPASAVIAGIQAASGEYIGFLDSDDWIDPDYFETLYRTAVERQADIVTVELLEHLFAPARDGMPVSPKACYDHVPGGPDFYPAPDGGRQELDLYFRCFILDQSPAPAVKWRCDKFYRRSLALNNLPYCDTDLWCGEDLAMNLAVLADCRSSAVLRGSVYYHYRRREDSASRTYFSSCYEQRHMDNDAAFYAIILRIARDKHLPMDTVYAFLGRMVYRTFFRLAQTPDQTIRQKCGSIRRLLAAAPGQTLKAYASCRRRPSVRLICAMLWTGAAPLCVLPVSLRSSLARKKH